MNELEEMNRSKEAELDTSLADRQQLKTSLKHALHSVKALEETRDRLQVECEALRKEVARLTAELSTRYFQARIEHSSWQEFSRHFVRVFKCLLLIRYTMFEVYRFGTGL